ncbi:hypothetical protein T484DRAFT_1923860 [Baffinella frigidus]|nr:hypothetical protein T484DRAFT_1923860 [Cryptophyta sp. CCMP2293]
MHSPMKRMREGGRRWEGRAKRGKRGGKSRGRVGVRNQERGWARRVGDTDRVEEPRLRPPQARRGRLAGRWRRRRGVRGVGGPRRSCGRRPAGACGKAGGAKGEHVCATCGKAFKRSGHLDSHMRTHSGERPHRCETCDKAFSTSSSLAEHVRTHTREKPHVCETCGKAFSTSSNLATHKRPHSGEKRPPL